MVFLNFSLLHLVNFCFCGLQKLDKSIYSYYLNVKLQKYLDFFLGKQSSNHNKGFVQINHKKYEWYEFKSNVPQIHFCLQYTVRFSCDKKCFSLMSETDTMCTFYVVLKLTSLLFLSYTLSNYVMVSIFHVDHQAWNLLHKIAVLDRNANIYC